jgi:hypothetical protein
MTADRFSFYLADWSKRMDTGEALTSGDIVNSDYDPVNMIDALSDLEVEVGRIANAITSYDLSLDGDEDSCGNHVTSLTEAVMGMTSPTQLSHSQTPSHTTNA